jgi:hypothetical protein
MYNIIDYQFYEWRTEFLSPINLKKLFTMQKEFAKKMEIKSNFNDFNHDHVLTVNHIEKNSWPNFNM